MDRFLATAVWDNSWRLWDLEQLTEVNYRVVFLTGPPLNLLSVGR